MAKNVTGTVIAFASKIGSTATDLWAADPPEFTGRITSYRAHSSMRRRS